MFCLALLNVEASCDRLLCQRTPHLYHPNSALTQWFTVRTS
jgi:hypothetical protein